MNEYSLIPNAIDKEQLKSLYNELLSSPLVGQSTLEGSFYRSRGFAITFRRDGVEALLHQFPALRSFWELMEAQPTVKKNSPWHFWRPAVRANAFYLNLLLLEAGAGIGPHMDGTLRGVSQEPEAFPVRVTVLYLAFPQLFQGGHFRLYQGSRILRQIRPEAGTLLHFQGNLRHEVLPVRVAPGVHSKEFRASLVCEQYHFSDETLARIPCFRVHSRAGEATTSELSTGESGSFSFSAPSD